MHSVTPDCKVLVVSPHPDDAELGVGGMIHRRLELGGIVTIAVCTGDGDLTMVHSGNKITFEKRREEQEQAAKALGGASVVWLDLAQASRFDQQPQANFVSRFDALFASYDEVFLPLPSYNMDHEIVWKTGLAAFRPGKLDHVNLYAYEQPMQGHGDHTWGFNGGKKYFRLTKLDMRAKVGALLKHTSQMAGRENTIYGKAGVTSLAELRGLEVGHPFAEMVYLIREAV